MKHTVSNITFDMLRHVHVNANDHDVFMFELIDGGIHEVPADQLGDVFKVLTSVEFGTLLNYINKREDTEEKMHDMFNNTLENGPIETDLYEYGSVCMRYGSLRETVVYERDYLKERFGWNLWVSACRVYESLTGTPREWIS